MQINGFGIMHNDFVRFADSGLSTSNRGISYIGTCKREAESYTFRHNISGSPIGGPFTAGHGYAAQFQVLRKSSPVRFRIIAPSQSLDLKPIAFGIDAYNAKFYRFKCKWARDLLAVATTGKSDWRLI